MCDEARGGWDEWDEDDEMYEVDFDCDEEEMFVCTFPSEDIVPVERLEPVTRMYVHLMIEGPPKGCEPWLN